MRGKVWVLFFALAGPCLADDTVLEGSRDAQPSRLDEIGIGTEDERRLQAVIPPTFPINDANTKGLGAEATRGKVTKAISGDTVIFLGRRLRLADVECPPVDTDDGLRAKGLLNTFMRRSGFFRCEALGENSEGFNAICTVAERKGLKGRSIAVGMVQSGLCRAVDVADEDGGQ